MLSSLFSFEFYGLVYWALSRQLLLFFFILAVHSCFICFLFIFFFGFENFCVFSFDDYCFSSCYFFQNSIDLMTILMTNLMTITVKMDEINSICSLKKNPVPNPNENHLRMRQIPSLLDTFSCLELKVWTIEQNNISEFISVMLMVFSTKNKEVLCVYLQSRYPLTEKKSHHYLSRSSSNSPFALLCKLRKYQL